MTVPPIPPGGRDRGRCQVQRSRLTALVDDALAQAERERLLGHLPGCEACRSDVAELRAIRARLRATQGTVAPAGLTNRLVGIAGARADEPLYARPFDRGSCHGLSGRELPSRRRKRLAVLGAVTSVCVVMAGLVGAGWAAAPPTKTLALDPGSVARDEFATVVASMPLGNPAVNAVRAADVDLAKTTLPDVPEPAPADTLTATGAAAALAQADRASEEVPVAGRQLVQVRHLNGYWVADVDVAVRPGRGAQVTVQADRPIEAWIPEQTSGNQPTVGETHTLLVGPGPIVAGIPSSVIEAREGVRPVARWWVDPTSGVVLWQQTLDVTGETVVSAGYESVRIGESTPTRHLAPRLGGPAAASNVGLASGAALSSQGWAYDERLAELELIRVRGDKESLLHTVYGDGITTLSVIQQRGALAGAPDGFVWDPSARAYRDLGLTTMYAWQSGDTVFTVITDGSSALAKRALSELPSEAPVLRTRTDRIADGWRRLLGLT